MANNKEFIEFFQKNTHKHKSLVSLVIHNALSVKFYNQREIHTDGNTKTINEEMIVSNFSYIIEENSHYFNGSVKITYSLHLNLLNDGRLKSQSLLESLLGQKKKIIS